MGVALPAQPTKSHDLSENTHVELHHGGTEIINREEIGLTQAGSRPLQENGNVAKSKMNKIREDGNHSSLSSNDFGDDQGEHLSWMVLLVAITTLGLISGMSLCPIIVLMTCVVVKETDFEYTSKVPVIDKGHNSVENSEFDDVTAPESCQRRGETYTLPLTPLTIQDQIFNRNCTPINNSRRSGECQAVQHVANNFENPLFFPLNEDYVDRNYQRLADDHRVEGGHNKNIVAGYSKSLGPMPEYESRASRVRQATSNDIDGQKHPADQAKGYSHNSQNPKLNMEALMTEKHGLAHRSLSVPGRYGQGTGRPVVGRIVSYEAAPRCLREGLDLDQKKVFGISQQGSRGMVDKREHRSLDLQNTRQSDEHMHSSGRTSYSQRRVVNRADNSVHSPYSRIHVTNQTRSYGLNTHRPVPAIQETDMTDLDLQNRRTAAIEPIEGYENISQSCSLRNPVDQREIADSRRKEALGDASTRSMHCGNATFPGTSDVYDIPKKRLPAEKVYPRHEGSRDHFSPKNPNLLRHLPDYVDHQETGHFAGVGEDNYYQTPRHMDKGIGLTAF